MREAFDVHFNMKSSIKGQVGEIRIKSSFYGSSRERKIPLLLDITGKREPLHQADAAIREGAISLDARIRISGQTIHRRGHDKSVPDLEISYPGGRKCCLVHKSSLSLNSLAHHRIRHPETDRCIFHGIAVSRERIANGGLFTF